MLHIGSVRTALFNWIYARHHGGTFILRVEDTDAARNTKEAVQIIFDGLRWAGVDWDEGPIPESEGGGSKGAFGPYFQSQRSEIYRRHLEKLLKSGHAYESEGAVKLKIPKTPITVPDLICGDVVIDRAKEPDLVLMRKDGSFLFHYGNVIDDLEMQVSHVIRGEEHLMNTPKHLEIFTALGEKPPRYAHLPLILNPNGSKMSKRDDGAKVADYIEQGYLPEAVCNYLCLLGWSPKDNREILPLEEIVAKFDLPQIHRGNAQFDKDKLFWMNGEYMRALPLEKIEPMARKMLAEHGVLASDATVDSAYFRAALEIVREKIKIGREIPDWMSCFFRDDFSYDAKAAAKDFTATGIENLQRLREKLSGTADFSAAGLETLFKQLAADTGQKTGAFIHPTRLAVSGRPVGPSLYHLLEVLGRDRVLGRLQRAIETKGQPTRS